MVNKETINGIEIVQNPYDANSWVINNPSDARKIGIYGGMNKEALIQKIKATLNIKFPVGSKVNRSGYPGVVTEIRNNEQRYVRLESGEVCVDVHDLAYW